MLLKKKLKPRRSLALEPRLNVRRPKPRLKPTRRRPQRKLLLKPWLKRPNAPAERLRSRESVKRRRPRLLRPKREAKSQQPRVKKLSRRLNLSQRLKSRK